MFKSMQVEPVDYSDPWNIEFEARFFALNRGSVRIAYFYDVPDTSTFRYRVFNMVQALAENNNSNISASWFHRGDIGRINEVIDRVDALIFCRTRYTPAIENMIMRARNRNVRIIYDVDDLVFNTDLARLVMDTLDQDLSNEASLNDWFAYMARQGTVLRLCDHVITTNEFLGKQVKAFVPHVTVNVVPNFLNREQQRLSTHFFQRKKADQFKSTAPYRIGYFSGSPTHQRDFSIVSKALSRIMDTDRNVRLLIVGFLSPGLELAKHMHRIDQYPLHDFLNLQRLIAETEINIAPLLENTFTNCKSELKFFEAAISGTITVASPTPAFKEAIVDGHTGFLANSHEWEEKLTIALSMIKAQDTYSDMALEGFNYAQEKYGWNRHADSIINAALS